MSTQEIVGLQGLIERLRNASADIPQSVGDALDTAMGRVTIPQLGIYPSATGGSYVRTYRLKRGWVQRSRGYTVSGNTIKVTARNNTPYGGYVQGKMQAGMHRGRWRTVDQIIDATRYDAISIVIDRLQDIADGIAG